MTIISYFAQLFLVYTFDDLVSDDHHDICTQNTFPIHLLMVTMMEDLGQEMSWV